MGLLIRIHFSIAILDMRPDSAAALRRAAAMTRPPCRCASARFELPGVPFQSLHDPCKCPTHGWFLQIGRGVLPAELGRKLGQRSPIDGREQQLLLQGRAHLPHEVQEVRPSICQLAGSAQCVHEFAGGTGRLGLGAVLRTLMAVPVLELVDGRLRDIVRQIREAISYVARSSLRVGARTIRTRSRSRP